MRANEFITEAANILNVVAHDPRAVALFKSLLTIRGYNHYMRLVRKTSIDNSDVWQGENGWAHVSIKGVTARLTISTDHVEVQVVRLSEVFPTVTQAIGQPTHFYKLITSPLSAADDIHRRNKALKNSISLVDRHNYRLYEDPIFRKYLVSVMHKFVDYFNMTDRDDKADNLAYDLEEIQNTEHNNYAYRNAIIGRFESDLINNILHTLCEKYNWDYDEILDENQADEYLYRAKIKDKIDYYKIVKQEIIDQVKARYAS